VIIVSLDIANSAGKSRRTLLIDAQVDVSQALSDTMCECECAAARSCTENKDADSTNGGQRTLFEYENAHVPDKYCG